MKKKLFVTALLVTLLFTPAALAEDTTTLEDVWMRHGGVRLYYDALTRPRQIYLNGARRTDPAWFVGLPPLYGQEKPRRAHSAPLSRTVIPVSPSAPGQTSHVPAIPPVGQVKGTASAAVARPGGEGPAQVPPDPPTPTIHGATPKPPPPASSM